VEEGNITGVMGIIPIGQHSEQTPLHAVQTHIHACREQGGAAGEHAKAKDQSSRPFARACKPAVVKRMLRVNFKVSDRV